MDEAVGQQQWRTRVKGSVASFQTPWADIIEDLKRNVGDVALDGAPRSVATAKYMLRASKQLHELKVRPRGSCSCCCIGSSIAAIRLSKAIVRLLS